MQFWHPLNPRFVPACLHQNTKPHDQTLLPSAAREVNLTLEHRQREAIK